MPVNSEVEKMKKKRKVILGIGLGLIVLATLFTVVKKMQPLKVASLEIMPQKYESYIVEEGTVKSANQYAVLSPESENVTSVKVGEGQKVKQGDVLFLLDDSQLNYDLQALEANLESLQGQSLSESEAVDDRDLNIQRAILKKAQRDLRDKETAYEANEALYESGAISKDVYQDSMDDYYDAINTEEIERYRLDDLKAAQELGTGKKQYYQGQEKALNLEIEQMQLRLEAITVRAPIAGYVSGMTLSVGDYVQEDSFLFELVSPEQLFVEAYVDSKVAKLLKLEDIAIIEVPKENDYAKIEGKISSIGTVAQEIISPLGLIEKKVKVLLAVEDKEALIVGESVDIDFITFSDEQVIALSRDYTFPWQAGKGIWVIQEGRAKVQPIEPIYESASKVIIESGEALNIIVPPYDERLEEGMSVE